MLSITIKPFVHPGCTKCKAPAQHIIFLRKPGISEPQEYSCAVCLHAFVNDYIEYVERRGNA